MKMSNSVRQRRTEQNYPCPIICCFLHLLIQILNSLSELGNIHVFVRYSNIRKHFVLVRNVSKRTCIILYFEYSTTIIKEYESLTQLITMTRI